MSFFTPTRSSGRTNCGPRIRWFIAVAAFEQAPARKDVPELQHQAAEQAAVARADFLRRYDLQRLPSDPATCRRAAEMLRGQGREELTREGEAKVVRKAAPPYLRILRHFVQV